MPARRNVGTAQRRPGGAGLQGRVNLDDLFEVWALQGIRMDPDDPTGLLFTALWRPTDLHSYQLRGHLDLYRLHMDRLAQHLVDERLRLMGQGMSQADAEREAKRTAQAVVTGTARYLRIVARAAPATSSAPATSQPAEYVRGSALCTYILLVLIAFLLILFYVLFHVSSNPQLP